jgi:hypothetical protein
MKFLASLLAICCAAQALIAQAAPKASESEAEGQVFAPFVSRISAEVKNDLIKITWIDSRDAIGPVYVYRSTADFLKTGIPGSVKPIEVPRGAQSYIDQVDAAGTWHYFVAASNEKGTKYEVLIPFGNVLAVSVTPLATQEAVAVGAANASSSGAGADAVAGAGKPGPEAAKASTAQAVSISGISASVEEDAVRISYASESPEKTPLLYRSAQPLRRIQDLLDAVIAQAGTVGGYFLDYPVPGIQYYYAIIYEEDLKRGAVNIVSGKNATVVPVEVSAGRYRIGLPGPMSEIRTMPLPLIAVQTIVPGAGFAAFDAAVQVPLSLEASKAVSQLSMKTKPRLPPDKKPRAFAQDLAAPAGGEEDALRSIVQGPFARKDWKTAADEFSKYLSLPRTANSEARARFYLGQALYFSGRMRESLFEFLLVQNQYPGEASEWLQAVLPRLPLDSGASGAS